MPYIHFTKEQIQQAKDTDLVQLLQSRCEQLKRSGSEYVWKDGSGKVTIRGNKWFHQYEQAGGTAIDFVRRFFNADFPEAMEILLGTNFGTLQASYSKPKQTTEFKLPEANPDMRRVYAYLLKQRFIDREVIHYFTHNKMLYEDKEYHNAVFVGYDEQGIPRHAHKRGTYGGSSYKGNIAGSNADYSFHYTGTSSKLYAFEAPLDMMSFLSLYQSDWKMHSYVALCSVAEHAVIKMLKLSPNIDTVILCLDYDKAGIEGCFRIAENIRKLNRKYKVSRLEPKYKDWNEQLKEKNDMEPLPGIPHPNMEYIESLCLRLQEEKIDDCPKRPFDKLTKMLDTLKKTDESNINYIDEQTLDMTKLALSFCIMRHRQLGVWMPESWYIDKMHQKYRPHRDKGSYKNRIRNIEYKLKNIIHDYCQDKIYTKSEIEMQIERTLELGLTCLSLNAYTALQAQKNVPVMQQSM